MSCDILLLVPFEPPTAIVMDLVLRSTIGARHNAPIVDRAKERLNFWRMLQNLAGVE